MIKSAIKISTKYNAIWQTNPKIWFQKKHATEHSPPRLQVWPSKLWIYVFISSYLFFLLFCWCLCSPCLLTCFSTWSLSETLKAWREICGIKAQWLWFSTPKAHRENPKNIWFVKDRGHCMNSQPTQCTIVRKFLKLPCILALFDPPKMGKLMHCLIPPQCASRHSGVPFFHIWVVFFLGNVGSCHFVGAYAGAMACLCRHSGSLRGKKLKEICLRACGFVQEVPTRLQSRRLFDLSHSSNVRKSGTGKQLCKCTMSLLAV